MSLSLIVPVYNRADHLARLLCSVAAQETVPDEVIVVDDGSSDRSVEEATQVAPSTLHVIYIRTENPGETNCCHAQNIGLKVASSDEIVRTDPEIEFCCDALGQLRDERVIHPEDVIGAIKSLSHMTNDPCTDPTDPMQRSWQPATGWAYLWMAKREWLVNLGGWDEELPGKWGWDDSDLMLRLAYVGHPLWYAPEIEIRHHWHPSRIDHDSAYVNEQYVNSKTFPSDLVANQNRIWGIPRA